MYTMRMFIFVQTALKNVKSPTKGFLKQKIPLLQRATFLHIARCFFQPLELTYGGHCSSTEVLIDYVGGKKPCISASA